MFGFLRHGETSLFLVFYLGHLRLNDTPLTAVLGFVCLAAACREVNDLRRPEDFIQITHWCKQELILLKSKKTVKGLLFLN